MSLRHLYRIVVVASLLGGATLLFSCSGKKKPAEIDLEKLITQQSDTLTMIYTKNGKKDYRFSTPLMERYELAREPYMEFRYGINIITFDSLGNEASNLIADYAIYYEHRELWEARGNVEGTGEDGRKLYTQQLFWDEKTDKVYSNVDCKVVDGLDVFVGEGFESDSEFKDWVFRESEGRMWVDVSESEEGEGSEAQDAKDAKDSTVTNSVPAKSEAVGAVDGDKVKSEPKSTEKKPESPTVKKDFKVSPKNTKGLSSKGERSEFKPRRPHQELKGGVAPQKGDLELPNKNSDFEARREVKREVKSRE